MKTVKKTVICILLATLLLALVSTGVSADGLYPDISSDNVIVVYNIESGQTLYSHKGEDVVAPTAATKLVTMMVVWDLFTTHGINPKTQMVTVTGESLSGIGTLGDKSAPRLGLTVGNSFTAEDLISATLVGNANDACNVLAHYCATELLSGQLDAFIALMNEKAVQIGTKNSYFKNATGLDQNGMVTTPSDVALIAAAFYKYNDLLVISNQSSFRFNNGGTVHTKNYLLSDALISKYKMQQALGIIAGQRTDTADYTLISAVEKDGLSYIIVIMEATGELRNPDGTRSFAACNAYDDMKILIPWTQSSFGYKTLIEEGELIAELRVAMGKNYDYVAVVPKEKLERLVNKGIVIAEVQRKIVFDENIVYKGEYKDNLVDMVDAPIIKGQVVGTLTLLFNGEELGSVELVAQSSVDASGLLSTASNIKGFLFGSIMRKLLMVFGGIIAAYVLFSLVTAVIRAVKRIKKATSRRKKAQNDD